MAAKTKTEETQEGGGNDYYTNVVLAMRRFLIEQIRAFTLEEQDSLNLLMKLKDNGLSPRMADGHATHDAVLLGKLMADDAQLDGSSHAAQEKAKTWGLSRTTAEQIKEDLLLAIEKKWLRYIPTAPLPNSEHPDSEDVYVSKTPNGLQAVITLKGLNALSKYKQLTTSWRPIIRTISVWFVIATGGATVLSGVELIMRLVMGVDQ